jgi:hypothetical protein
MPYQYLPLESSSSFRLIRLLPDLVESQVAFTLTQFDLHNAPDYSALSYCWGDPKQTRTVRIDEYEHPLPENLWQFLRQMWKDKRLGYYWTDGLCIDQGNMKERNHQVGCMGEIYSIAQQVIIWLGNDKQGEDSLRTLSHFKRQVDQDGDLRDEDIPLCRESGQYLLDYDYWLRVWIIQEVVLSKKAYVTCGSTSMEFQDFQTAIRAVAFRHSSQYRSEESYRRRMLTQISTLQREGRKQDLWELLWRFEKSICTDERDKVYGLLGLLPDNDSDECAANLIQVDYTKPTSDVFWDAVFECKAPWGESFVVLDALHSNPRLYRLSGTDFKKALRVRVTLQDYSVRKSTSSRHVGCALATLGVLAAMDVVIEVFQPILKEGPNFIISSSLVKAPAEQKTTYLQDACALGLVLSRCAHSNSKPEKRILWSCAVHRVAQQYSDSVLNETPRLQYKSIDESRVARVLASICDCCKAQTDLAGEKVDLSGPVIDLTYDNLEADFQMSIYSQITENGGGASLQVAISSSNWTHSVDIWDNIKCPDTVPTPFRFEGPLL